MPNGVRLLLLLMVFLSTVLCSRQPVEPAEETSNRAIIGGALVVDGEYPAVGAILTKGVMPRGNPPEDTAVGKMVCTATLVAPDVIITAAHCTEVEQTFYNSVGSNIENYFTLSNNVQGFGYNTLTPPADSVLVTSFVRHPDYDRAGFEQFPVGLAELKDVAVGFLANSVAGVTPAVVMEPDDDTSLVLDAPVEIVGYGMMSVGGYVGINAQASSFINESNPSEMQIGDEPPTPFKCAGDSGGPTFMRIEDGKTPQRRLIGVTSRAYDETFCEVGSIDTRADFYRDWFEQTMIDACTSGVRVACESPGLALPQLNPDGGVADTGLPDRASADRGQGGTDTEPEAPDLGCAG